LQADDALPSHGEFSIDQLCDNVSSNPDELEMDDPVACDCPSIPTCSEAVEHLEKYEHFLRSNVDVPEHKPHLTNISSKSKHLERHVNL
jgi:hypothetical protein